MPGVPGLDRWQRGPRLRRLSWRGRGIERRRSVQPRVQVVGAQLRTNKCDVACKRAFLSTRRCTYGRLRQRLRTGASPQTMPSPGWPPQSEQRRRTFEFQCPWCEAQLEIPSEAPRKRRRGVYGVSAPPEIRCTCACCNKLVDVEIPPESERSETDTRLEFDPASDHALPGYEWIGADGGAWCRVRGCDLSNQPCRRYEGGIICFCRPHWDIIRADEEYLRILRREALDTGRPSSI